MAEHALLAMLAALAALALLRPWMGLLALSFFGLLQPHTFLEGLSANLPVFKVLFFATVIGTLFSQDRRMPPRDWRVAALLLFWLGMAVSTYFAAFPLLAGPEFIKVSATLSVAILILMLINTPQKWLALLLASASALALVALKGGYWAIAHQFADRVYGPPGSHYYDNNHFAIAALMIFPVLLFWMRRTADRPLKLALGVLIALCLLAVLSSWSRGGFLALGATLALLAVERRGAPIAIAGIILATLAALFLMPEQWLERMLSIGAQQVDGSAQSRLEVWQKGLGFALGSPWTGTGFEGWKFGGGQLEWHSIYVQILAEHGFVAFAAWLALLIGTFAKLSRLIGRYRYRHGLKWIADYATALRASLAAYAVGGAFISIGYWDLLFNFVALAIGLQALAADIHPSSDLSRPRSEKPAAESVSTDRQGIASPS